MTPTSTPTRSHWMLLILVATIWGSSFMLMTVALQGFGPISVAAFRITLGAVILVVLAYTLGSGLPSLRGPNARLIWISAIGMGIFSNSLPFFLLSWGQQYVASGFAGVSMSTMPLIVLPLAHFLIPNEHMTQTKVLGFSLGTVGVVVLIGPSALASTGENLETLARLACLSAAGCYAIGAIITRLCPEVSRLGLAAATMLAACLTSLPFALAFEGIPTDLQPIPVLAILILGIFPTALAQLIVVKVVREAGPSFMALVNYQIPVWSLFMGWAVLNEHLPPSFFIALALILTGLAISQWPSLRRLLA